MYSARRGLLLPSPNGVFNRSFRGGARDDPRDLVNFGLVGHWSMDGGTISGTTLRDLSGLGNNITLSGSPPLVSGPFGRALSFNGSSQYGTASAGGLASNYDDVTVSFWANIPASQATQGGRILEKGANSEWTISVYDPTGGYIYFVPRNRDLTVDAISTLYVADAWAFYTFVINSSAPFRGIYINGVLQVSGATAGIVASNDTGGIYVGEYGGGGYQASFSIKDIRIVRRAATGAEIFRAFADTSGNLGSVSPAQSLAAAIAGGATYNQSCVATNTPASTLIRSDNKTLAITNAPSASIVKAVAAIKLATNNPLGFLTRQTGKTLSRSNAGAASLTRSTGKPFLATNAAVAALTAGLALLRTLSASNTPATSLARSTSKVVAATNAPSSTLIRAVTKALAASNAALATLTRSIAKSLSASNAAVAAVTHGAAYLQTISATNAATARLNRSVGKLVSATNTPASTLRRAVAKTLAVSNAAAATVARAIAKTISAANSAVASLARSITKTATTSNAASASVTSTRGKVLTATNAALAALATSFIAATASGIIIRVGVVRARILGAVARVRSLGAIGRRTTPPARPRS